MDSISNPVVFLDEVEGGNVLPLELYVCNGDAGVGTSWCSQLSLYHKVM
jgi:hypothetical protein